MADAPLGEDFAALIKEGRRRKRWSQDDLEAESGVSRSTLSRWERGLSDKPEPEHVRAVCLALGIDPRRAAVALGYLTAEEATSPLRPSLTPEIAEILEMLDSDDVPLEDKRELVAYLRYLRYRHQQNRNEQAG
jgi:transcriptional regulator with XRE-family HTH domain